MALERARVAMAEERDNMATAHKRRMGELDGIRKLLETRAREVEAAAKGVERERLKLHAEYEVKVREINEAKLRLEGQVGRMESKDAQLHAEWARFEADKAAAVAEAEAQLFALARSLSRPAAGGGGAGPGPLPLALLEEEAPVGVAAAAAIGSSPPSGNGDGEGADVGGPLFRALWPAGDSRESGSEAAPATPAAAASASGDAAAALPMSPPIGSRVSAVSLRASYLLLQRRIAAVDAEGHSLAQRERTVA